MLIGYKNSILLSLYAVYNCFIAIFVLFYSVGQKRYTLNSWPYVCQILTNFQNSFSTHTHPRLTALFPGLPRSASTRKEKPIWILPKQETVSGSGISWAVCKSAPHSRQITMPAPHYSFLQAGCPSCRPTNSVKALKAVVDLIINLQ